MLDIATQKSFQERLAAIRTLEKKDLLSPAEQTGSTIEHAGPSAFFEYLDQTYFIQELNRYEESSDDFKTPKGYFVYELTCLCLETGETVHFEWEVDDELEVAMTLDRFSFRHLTDDQGEGIDGDDLEQIAEEKDLVVVKHEKFWYEDDWTAVFHKNNRQENVYLYEFENESHTRFLTIEEWAGSSRDEYRIYTSAPVNPNNIKIISKGRAKE